MVGWCKVSVAVAVLAGGALLGCASSGGALESPVGAVDAGARADAGSTVDAGSTADAAPPVLDAGARTDAGSAVDASTPPRDAGSPSDAGVRADAATTTTDAGVIPWNANAEPVGPVGARLVFGCPPNPGVAAASLSTVWGTDVYTTDSAVCVAAVHAGRLSLALGGVVTIEYRGPLASYTGSTRNGITTQDWTSTWESFAFVP